MKAKLKVARPSNIRKEPEAEEAFKKEFERTLEDAIPTDYQGTIRLWVQDESRFGLLPIKRRRVTGKGVKPVGRMQLKLQAYYLYGAFGPVNGDAFFSKCPTWMEIVLIFF